MKFEITDTYARDEIAKLKQEVTQLHAEFTAYKTVADSEKKRLESENKRLDAENEDISAELDELQQSNKMGELGNKGVDAKLAYAAELESFMGEAFVMIQSGGKQDQIIQTLGPKYPRVILRMMKNPNILKSFFNKFANDAMKGLSGQQPPAPQ